MTGKLLTLDRALEPTLPALGVLEGLPESPSILGQAFEIRLELRAMAEGYYLATGNPQG